MSPFPWNTTITLRSADALAALILARRLPAFRATATVLGMTADEQVAFIAQTRSRWHPKGVVASTTASAPRSPVPRRCWAGRTIIINRRDNHDRDTRQQPGRSRAAQNH